MGRLDSKVAIVTGACLSSGTPTRAACAQLIPLGRLGDPELDAGGLVIYLASPGARYFTGQTFNLNGGQNMRP